MWKLFRSLSAVTALWLNIAAAQNISETKIIPSVGGDNEWFGASVSIDGDYAIVGASGATLLAGNAGSAFIFKRNGGSWIEQVKLAKNNGKDFDLFGQSVAIDGDYAIVGVPGDDSEIYYSMHINNGSAYIYKRDGVNWTPEAILIANDARDGDELGFSVDLDGNYAIVGARRDDNQGSAYIFVRSDTGWVQQAKLTASDAAEGEEFGYSVAISGDYVIAGVNHDGQGSAYIFVRNDTSWTEQTKLTASDGAALDAFGRSVGINGDYAIVGAPGNSYSQGAGYIFKRNMASWLEKTKLRASDGFEQFNVAWSVAISGTYVLLGAIGSGGPAGLTGAAYLYLRTANGWAEQMKINANDGADGAFFGDAVAIEGDDIIIGAKRESPLGAESGSAYLYRRNSLTQK